MLRRRGLLAAGFAAAALSLTACAIVDKYSDRAVEYNLQAEKTQQQNLLLNIIRASLRRPMQFTGLTSITGTASATGSVTGSYSNAHQTPYINLFNLIPPNSSTAISRTITGSGGPTASMSGGPTFTVPVLDTQEFYQGILTPVRSDIIDYYVQQGYQRSVLFELFVNSIEVVATDNYPTCDRFTFRNDVRNELSLAQFHALAEYLLVSGFTTERISESRMYGPRIFAPPPRNATETATLVDVYSKASAAGLDVREVRQPGQSGPAPAWRPRVLHLQKRASLARFCFAQVGATRPTWLGDLEDSAYCGKIGGRSGQTAQQSSGPAPDLAPQQEPGQDRTPRKRGTRPTCADAGNDERAGEGGSAQFRGIRLSEPFIRRMEEIQRTFGANYPPGDENVFDIRRFRNSRITFKFSIRSIEGILYYLGEITRQNLYPEFNTPSRMVQVKTRLRYGAYPLTECDSSGEKHGLVDLRTRRPDPRPYNCENLFVLETGLAPDAFYAVSYDGVDYSIPNEPVRQGRSLQVLELVKQLLALHTSAKQFPQSSVISIIGGTAQ
jgi:hypothetical protein